MSSHSPEQVFHTYSRALLRFIKHQLSAASSESEDILHDVFYRYLIGGEEIENVSGWLYRVARNLIIDRSRKQRETAMPYAEFEDQEVAFSDWALTDNHTPETCLAVQIVNVSAITHLKIKKGLRSSLILPS